MEAEFNADEVFELALQIERNGANFYRQAAERAVNNPSAVETLVMLAKMEDDHFRTFQGLRERLSRPEWQAPNYNPDQEAVLYLRALADSFVFNIKANPVQRLTGGETIQEILRTAIKLEQDSIVLYLGIKDVMPETSGREQVETIIREEKSHILTLARYLFAMAK